MADDYDEDEQAFTGWHDQAARDPVFRKWMEQELARREKVAAATVRPKSASSEFVTRAYLRKRLDSSLELVGRFLAEHLKPLQKRIAELESVSLKERGIWRRLGG